MPVHRRLARAGLAVLALSAGALAVALMYQPQLLRQGQAGKPDARGHRAGPGSLASTSAGSSDAPLAAPPLCNVGGDAQEAAMRSGAAAGPFTASGSGLAATPMGGFTPGPGLMVGAAEHDVADEVAHSTDGDASGGQGLRTQARGLTIAAVSTHRFGGSEADEPGLPDEPTSAGAPGVAGGSGGAMGWQAGGGGVFGSAAVGSFAAAIGIASASAVAERTTQFAGRSSAAGAATGALASAVPEPESAAMLVAGLLVLGAVTRHAGRHGPRADSQPLRGR